MNAPGAAVRAIAAANAANGPKTSPFPVPNATTRGRGKRLTDVERIEIITRLEDKAAPMSRAKAARLYGVTPAAIGKLMKNSQQVKKRYLDAGTEAGNARDKRQRGGFIKNVSFEDELYKWICSVRARNIPLLVAHVQQKAKLLAKEHTKSDTFKASNGWYYRFCSRYGLTPASLHASTRGNAAAGDAVAALPPHNSVSSRSGSNSVPEARSKAYARDSAEEHARKLKEVQACVAEYSPEFVYNLSEARMFYQLLPSHIRPPPAMNEHSSSIPVPRSAPGTPSLTPGKAPGSSARHRSAPSSSPSSSSSSPEGVGVIERILVLVCSNAAGTHKIPLLAVGKDPDPPSLRSLYGSGAVGGSSGSPLDVSAQYFSQREVWCDRHTLKHWCRNVFLPAIRQRTARPVLLLIENPGNHLDSFEQENVRTMFIPTPPQAPSKSSNVENSNGTHQDTSSLSDHITASKQPLECGVIRDLKRRYKISLFQAMLSFLERPDDEKFRLMQRAMKKPPGTIGVAFGRVPHVNDAIRLLEGSWNAIPSEMIRDCWRKSRLLAQVVPPPSPRPLSYELEISDELVVLELCSMLRNVTVVDDMNGLGKELRQWMSADDDNSDRMQQELLHDLQKILHEEEQNGEKPLQTTLQEHLQHQAPIQFQNSARGPQDGMNFEHLNVNAAHRLVAAGLDPAAAALAMGLDTQVMYRADMVHQGRPQHSMNGSSPSPMDPNMLMRERQKAITYAMRSLAAAEEALDSPFVADFFGNATSSAAMETVASVLRELRRVQRGKQSTLMAATASDSAQDEDASTTSAHQYFYGPSS